MEKVPEYLICFPPENTQLYHKIGVMRSKSFPHLIPCLSCSLPKDSDTQSVNQSLGHTLYMLPIQDP